MIVSWNWLTDYVRLEISVEELTERLATSGLNHERTTEVGGDLAIDLEVTSNRPDCLCHIGTAREISVLTGRSLSLPRPRPSESRLAVRDATFLRVETPELCPRFTLRCVRGVRVGESPWIIRKRLETLGIRPINNIVDITNYVMFECGQPLHAYDMKRVSGGLFVRRAKPGETLTAINNRKYELSSDMLVIADEAGPAGLAGVMGGLESEIGPKTTDVLIEAARFDSANVRATARTLGLSSDASFRFERGLDPEMTDWASRRTAELILRHAGGELLGGVIDANADFSAKPHPPVRLRFERIPFILGIHVDADRAVAILQALGLEVLERTAESVTVRPPSWRRDLEREIDLIEEVARIHGYDKIPENRPTPMALAPRAPRERVEEAIRSALVGLGFMEAVTPSLTTDELAAPIDLPRSETPAPPIRVEHSTRKRETVMRQSLAPSLLEARRHNEAHGSPDVPLFELANVYLPKPGSVLPDEPARLAIVSGGGYLELKGVVEALLDRLKIADRLEAISLDSPFFSAGVQARLALGGRPLGVLGQVAPQSLARFDLRTDCSAAELDLRALVDRASLTPIHQPTPENPAIARDLSLVTPASLKWAELEAQVRRSAGPYIESVTYLDTFCGGNLAPNERSVHFGLSFRHPERTLTGEEAEAAVNTIVSECGRAFGAKLRS